MLGAGSTVPLKQNHLRTNSADLLSDVLWLELGFLCVWFPQPWEAISQNTTNEWREPFPYKHLKGQVMNEQTAHSRSQMLTWALSCGAPKFLYSSKVNREVPLQKISRWSFQGEQASKAMTELLHPFPGIHSLPASTAKWVICLKNKMRRTGSHPPAPSGSTPPLELQLLQPGLPCFVGHPHKPLPASAWPRCSLTLLLLHTAYRKFT